MYQFPEGLYTDVRIETCFSTNIVYENHELKQSRVKEDSGAMIRVFDGQPLVLQRHHRTGADPG